MMTVTFSSGDLSYRVIKAPMTVLNHAFLRASAGLPPLVWSRTPTVSFVGSPRWSGQGRASVTITGSGLSGATAVSFGPKKAPAFTVNNDSSITAVLPIGTGVCTVTVTTPGGTSASTAVSILTASDSGFEGDFGSWRSPSSLAVTTSFARSGAYGLQVSHTVGMSQSIAGGQYAVPPGAQVIGAEWVLTPGRRDRVRAFIAF